MNEILQQRIKSAARECDYQYEKEELAFISGGKYALQNQWISVDEALPPVKNVYEDEKWSDWVLIRTHKGGAYMDSYIFHKHTWTNNGDDVTHWMQIPSLKGGEE